MTHLWVKIRKLTRHHVPNKTAYRPTQDKYSFHHFRLSNSFIFYSRGTLLSEILIPKYILCYMDNSSDYTAVMQPFLLSKLRKTTALSLSLHKLANIKDSSVDFVQACDTITLPKHTGSNATCCCTLFTKSPHSLLPMLKDSPKDV